MFRPLKASQTQDSTSRCGSDVPLWLLREKGPEEGSLAARDLWQGKEGSCPPAFYSLLLLSLSSPLASFFPCPPAVANTPQVPPLCQAPQSPGNRADRAAGMVPPTGLGRASRLRSTQGQTGPWRAEGPCWKPHISQDKTGVKGHLVPQVRAPPPMQWRQRSIHSSRPPRTNRSVFVPAAS